MNNSEKLVLLFDGSCNFCTATAELLRRLDWRHRLRCLPFQAPGLPQTYGLTLAQCERDVWVISPDGSRYPGAQAVSVALDALVGIPVFRWLYHVPGIGPSEDKAYSWVASHRQFLPGIRPYCERPGSPCHRGEAAPGNAPSSLTAE